MIDILIVDDNIRIHKAIQMVLNFDEFNKYNLQKAYNGQEALTIFKSRSFDLCLMDVDMPVMGGIEAAKKFRSQHTCGYMPIIAITGHRLDNLQNEFKEKVFDDYIEKPFSSDELIKKIDEWYLTITTVEKKDNKINFSKERPMDKEQLEKLKELRKQNLGFLMLRGTRDIFITHKNIQNKISYDFSCGKFLSEFLDRNPENPGNIHLYSNNMPANQWILTPEEMTVRIKIEDELLEKEIYQKPTEEIKSK